MELQIIKTEGYVKGETCKQEPVFTNDNDTLIKCTPNGQKTIIIPKGIKTIGRACFAGTNVEEVVLPEGIETIDSDAFNFCTKLRKINFPETLKVIGHGAFKGCFFLETVILPKTMKEISDYAFYEAGIKQLILPENVNFVGTEVFAGTDIETTDIPENFTLNSAMFEKCQKLHSINLLGSHITIPERCFCNCINLTEIDITKTALIKDEAFRGCQNLSVSTIPADTLVAVSAFEESGATDVIIEDISKVCNRVFADCKSLKKLTINVADGPTSVSSALVKGCKNLQTVVFTGRTKNLTVIEAAAFKETKNLNTISLPDTIKTISKEAFYDSGIENIHLPENLRQIGIMAFAGSGLKDIVIPNKIKKLGDYAFYNCIELTAVTLPESVTKIPSGIFEDCCSLKTVNVPNVDTICDHAFYGCKNLETFDFSKLQSLDLMAFAYTGIREAVFSDKFSQLGISAFHHCKNLQTVDMKACKIQEIPYQCFCFCKGLKDVQLPQDVTAFDNSCFLRAKLNKLTINAGTYVGNNAFSKSFISELIFTDDTNHLMKTVVHSLAFEDAKVGKLAIPDHMYDRFKDAIDKIQ
jgi:hypothetical protein